MFKYLRLHEGFVRIYSGKHVRTGMSLKMESTMMMKNKLKYTLASVVMGIMVSGGAVAATDTVEASSAKHAKAATEYRQAMFQLIRSNMGPLGGMAKGALPFDESVMMTNAVRLEQLADMMSDYLKVDTRKFDVDTDTKDALWDNFSDVETKIAALKDASVGLQAAVKSGDKDSYRNAIGSIGASCKSCHDDYKKD